MIETVYFIILGIIISVALNIFFQKVFFKRNQIDEINFRSSHNVKATKTGGVSTFLTVFILSLIYYSQKIELFDYSIILPLAIITLVGIYDDAFEINFKIKFIFQIIIAKLFIDLGFHISNLHGFIGLFEVPNLVGQALTILSFLIIVNSINFIDGIDSLAITIFSFSVCILTFILIPDSKIKYLNLFSLVAVIPLFYLNNKKEKKVFLGDAGSLFLGSIVFLNIMLVLNPNQGFNFHFNKINMAVSLIIYPLLDLTRVFYIRVRNKQSPFLPDKNHIHHFIFKFTESHFITSIYIAFFSITFFCFNLLLEYFEISYVFWIAFILIEFFLIKFLKK